DYCGQDGSMLAHGAKDVYTLQRSYLRIYPDTGTPKTKHVTTNVSIDVSEAENSATSRSYFTIFQATDELALQPITAGRYSDVFERVSGAWRFKSRQIIIDLMGDLSKHLLQDVSGVVEKG
ncbi:MAG: SnoaL-like domain-containing protein, partial [Pseudomonadales bacterium]|nr:SnoaL-like domain-containing protein [Pseudomonadales bacterium]